MRILWLTNIPSPYRVNFFNQLGKYCDLTVLFENKSSKERDVSWKNFEARSFKAVFLKGKRIGVADAICPSVIKYLNKNFDFIIITNYSDPTGIIAVCYLKFRGIPYQIEGDGAFPIETKGVKFLLKKFCLSGAKTCFSTAKLHDKYYLINGVNASRIVRYPFSSISDSDILKEPRSLDEKTIIRKNLEVQEKYMLLAVGQIIPRKGYDILIKAAADLGSEFGVYIVGGRITCEYRNLIKDLKCNNVHFINFKKTEELTQYYEAADVFVHPTKEDIWGLVINEAMAKGLPIITTDHCIAGLELVENDYNGYIVPINDPKALQDAVKKAVKHKDFARHSLLKIQDYTIEKMVLAHLKTWNNRGN